MTSSASGGDGKLPPRKPVRKRARKGRSPLLSDREFVQAAQAAGLDSQLKSKIPIRGNWLRVLDDRMSELESSPLVFKYYEVGEGDLAQWEQGIGIRRDWFLYQIAQSRADLADGAASKSPNSPSCTDPTLEPKGALRVQEFHIAHAMMKFLWFFRREKSIAGAIDRGDIPFTPFRRWRTRYPWFNALVQDDEALVHQNVKRAIYERAVIGVDKPLVYQGLIQTKQLTDKFGTVILEDGKPVIVPETVKEYSDSLMPLAMATTAPAADKSTAAGSDMATAAMSMQVEDIRDKVMQRLAGRLATTTSKPVPDKRGEK